MRNVFTNKTLATFQRTLIFLVFTYENFLFLIHKNSIEKFFSTHKISIYVWVHSNWQMRIVTKKNYTKNFKVENWSKKSSIKLSISKHSLTPPIKPKRSTIYSSISRINSIKKKRIKKYFARHLFKTNKLTSKMLK